MAQTVQLQKHVSQKSTAVRREEVVVVRGETTELNLGSPTAKPRHSSEEEHSQETWIKRGIQSLADWTSP